MHIYQSEMNRRTEDGHIVPTAVEIKQERIDTSPDGMLSHHQQHHHDNNGECLSGGHNIKLEPSDMKPPPEKKSKMM